MSDYRRLLTMAAMAVLVATFAAPALAGYPLPTEGDPPDEVLMPVKVGVSPILRDIPVTMNRPPANMEGREVNTRNVETVQPMGPAGPHAGDPDTVVQDTFSPLAMPGPDVSFDGISNFDNGALFGFLIAPPDTQGDVGPNHYVQWVNIAFGVWDKAGALVGGPYPGNALWTGFGGSCETDNLGDPITLYDHLADRWMMSQFTNDNHQCIAVSQTGDPMGAYYLYDYEPIPGLFPDYPKFGVGTGAYYYTANMFDFTYQGSVFGAFDRERMLQGLPAGFQVWFAATGPVYSPFYSPVPADLDGPSLEVIPMPVGWFAQMVDDGEMGAPNDALNFYAMVNDWVDPANSVFIPLPEVDLTAAGYPFQLINQACGRDCIPQPNGQYVDDIGDRLMHKMQYREFEHHVSWVVSHTVDRGDGVAAVRWYEMRFEENAPGMVIRNVGTLSPDDTNRWMGDLAMDAEGNIAVGYSVSSDSVYPGIRWAGRLANDPLNVLSQGEASVIEGTGSQYLVNRWGDYSTMSVDPVDDCTFWYTQEYYGNENPGVFGTWQTRVASFKFPNCTSGPQGTIEGTVTSSSSGQPLEGVWIDLGAYNTMTDAAGHYSLPVPAGTYDVKASKFWYVTQTAAGVVIPDGETVVQDFALADAALATIDGYATDAGHGWPLYARIDISWGFQPVQTLFTNPFNGYYITQLPDGLEYNFEVSVVYPGYDPMLRTVMLTGDSFENFIFEPNGTCSAPGYGFVGPLIEDFEGPFPPAGWSVDTVSGGDWTNTDPGGRGNLTGGTGLFAIVDSDWAGSANSDLLTPVMNVDGIGQMPFSFNYDYWDFGDVATVDISLDGGAWSNIVDFGGSDARGPALYEDTIDFTGATTAQLRFHYVAGWSWWWQVDDVNIATCEMLPGAIIAGFVTDANTTLPLDGALVESDTGNMTYAFPTPDDPAIGDAFYALFTYMPGLGPSTREITASYPSYVDGVAEETWVPDEVNRQDFPLGAGWLEVTPTMLEERVDAGLIGDDILTFINNGTASAHVELAKFGIPLSYDPPTMGPMVIRPLPDTFEPNAMRDPDNTTSGEPSAPTAFGDVLGGWAALPDAWGIALDPFGNRIWSANFFAPSAANEYFVDGTPTGNGFDMTGLDLVADWAFDPINGMYWVHADDLCIHEFDAGLGLTGNTICPVPAFPTSQRGLAYDPISDTFFSGDWVTDTIYRFDRAGNMIDIAPVEYLGQTIGSAGLAYNPDTGHLFALEAQDPSELFIIDVDAGYVALDAVPIAGMVGGGLDFACDGTLLAVAQNLAEVWLIDSGETDVCAWALNTDWLELSSYDFMAAPGQTDIDVMYDTTVLPLSHFGLHKAKVTIGHDTPYPLLSEVPVYMTKAFHDIPHGFWADAHIHGLAGIGVTKGCGFNNYCPESILNRAQMAVFIVRLTHGPDFIPPPAVGIFADVPLEDYGPFADFIEQLFNDGVTVGCGPNLYCPEDSTLRSEMAVFITKAKGWMPVVPTGIFPDVPTDYWSAGYIEKIATEGVTSGCGGGLYCPEDEVSRAEMAVFLVNGWNVETYMHPLP